VRRGDDPLSLNLTTAEFGLQRPDPPKPALTVLRAMAMWLRYQRQQNTANTNTNG
jgi:hypothetical protein